MYITNTVGSLPSNMHMSLYTHTVDPIQEALRHVCVCTFCRDVIQLRLRPLN